MVAGRYRLVEKVGGGAMGVVWRGRDESLDRVIAVKELLLHNGFDEVKTGEAKQRAMREARIAARLQHPHAITVFDVVEESDRPWLIMEYLPSKSLAEVLYESGPLPVADVVKIGRQLASALLAAHQAGIVHRDVKPGNVLLGEDGTVKITDFGISRAAGDVTVTATGEVAGTPGFFSPEVARGSDANAASDVFSLGATLYTAVEGTPPFGHSENAIALLYRVARGETVPPQQAGALTPILTRLLANDPEERPTTAEAFELLNDPALERGTAAGGGGSRRRVLIAALAAVVLIAATVLTVLLTRDGENPGNTAAPPTTQQPSTSPPNPAPPPAEQSTSNTPSPPSSPPSTSPAAVPLEQAIQDYYALIPGNLQAGYARLTDRFKQSRAQTFAKYEGFWRSMRAEVSGVAVSGQNTVSATITFIENGQTKSREHHVYTLVQSNGQWMIDSQSS